MKIYKHLLVAALLVALGGAACSGIGGGQETLVAENAMLSTQISDIRGTATIMADQLARTTEAIQTAVEQVQNRRNELSATLQAAGIDPASIAQVSPNPAFVGNPTPNPQAALSGPPVATPDPSGATSDLTIPTPTPGQPSLFGLVTAAGVGDNDCALAAVNTFASSTERIYVVATAANIAPGVVLGAEWYQDNVLLVSQDFTPDFAINENCIWFFVDQTDFVFAAGSYAIQLTINSAPAGQRVAFSITG